MAVKNKVVKAMIMKLSKSTDEVEYKNGNKYCAKHKWWDDNSKNKIPVVINYSITPGNVMGVVDKFEKDAMGNVYATMILNLEDQDDMMRLNSSIFCAGIVNTLMREKDQMLIGKINVVSIINKKYYPYRTKNLASWQITAETKKSAAYKVKQIKL